MVNRLLEYLKLTGIRVKATEDAGNGVSVITLEDGDEDGRGSN